MSTSNSTSVNSNTTNDTNTTNPTKPNNDDESTSNPDTTKPDPESFVPELGDSNITFAELQIASKVLNAIGQQFLLKKQKKIKNKKYRQKKHKQKKRQRLNDKDGNNGKGDNNDKKSDGDDDDERMKNQTKEIEDYNQELLKAYQHVNLRPIRKAIHPLYELHQYNLYEGQNEDTYYSQRMEQRTLKRQKMAESLTQQKYINSTLLRKGRMDKLNALKMDSRKEEEDKIELYQYDSKMKKEREGHRMLMIPDGHVDTNNIMEIDTADNNSDNGNVKDPLRLLNGPQNGEDDKTDNGNPKKDDNDETKTNETLLPKLRHCYVCKIRYRKLHHFYDQLCPECANFNYQKRHQSTPLHGKVAIVTGSRVKIGYQSVLKLLRAGCFVIATTRFPNLAADTYRKEVDFDKWKHLLVIYGLDLRDVIGLELFIAYVKMKFGSEGGNGIDILINNACQTVRRPTGYYKPLVEKEKFLWEKGDTVHRELLKGCLEFEALRRKKLTLDQEEKNEQQQQQLIADESVLSSSSAIKTSDDDDNDSSLTSATKVAVASTLSSSSITKTTTTFSESTTIQPSFETTGISHSTAMSQMVLLPEDDLTNNLSSSSSILPPNISDINGQQLDLRKTNSWLLKLDQVSTPEIIECMFINTIAPFVLNSRLQPLLQTIPNGSNDVNDRPDRYVVNVSAMEGKFYRYKMPNHPHTNMAKASLNMMTRTSAEDLAKKHRIFMNSVDTVSRKCYSISLYELNTEAPAPACNDLRVR